MGFVASVFLVTLAGTGAVEALMPPGAPELVGQERRDAKEMREQQSFWDGSLARSQETKFRLHGRVRRWLGPYWAAAMLRLNDAPTEELIVGRDGWLFLRERVHLPDRPWDGRGQHLANLLGLVSRSLASRGTELICLPVPRKSSACQDHLPVGKDCNPSFDAAVVRALTGVGVTTVDVGPVWEGHPSDDLYIKHDSHWAWPARRMSAEALKRKVPKLPQGDTAYSLSEGAERACSDGLSFAGVGQGHPANALFDPAREPRLSLLPEGSEAEIDGGKLGSDVLLVGTSFSELFQFRAHLCEVLQAPVEDASELGRMPLLSLERALITRSVDSFPAYVITEFPVHHAASIHRSSVPTVRAALGIARQLNFAGRSQGLPAELFCQGAIDAPGLRAPVLSFPPGSLLSSGDGILGIRWEFDGAKDSKWIYSTAGAEVTIGAKKGQRARTFPVLEGGSEGGYYASLTPATRASLGTTVRATVVTDADLSSGFEFTGSRSKDGVWSATPVHEVARQDSLALSWDEATTGPVEIIATGEDRGAHAVEKTWRFPEAHQVRFAILTLGPFEGGHLDEVKLKGAGRGAKGVIAQQVRAL